MKNQNVSLEEWVCKWIDKKVNEGRGALVFSLEENDGMIGVWVGIPSEDEKPLGYGSNVVEAVMHAASWDAFQQRMEPTSDSLPPRCPECRQRHTWKHLPAK